MIDPELIAAILEELEEKEEPITLTIHTDKGKVNELTEEGEWVDVTEKWSGEEKEN